MENVNQIEKLSKNITKLISLYIAEEEKSEKLTIENNNLKQELEKLENKNTELEIKYNNIKIGKIIGNKAENKDAKDKISKMIREIDNCISLLNK
ncbi:MAG: hypothetical protein LBV69_02970 [Bacteroidales bacterium]|nr:hypothetical protein [Bacteroidales bacterium]